MKKKMSYQMNIWHKVAQNSRGDSKRPHPVRHNVKDTQVEVLSDSSDCFAPLAPSLGCCLSLGLRMARPHGRRAHGTPRGE